MKNFRTFLFLAVAAALLVLCGGLLGADCLVLALIGLATVASLLASIMSAEVIPPHSMR